MINRGRFVAATFALACTASVLPAHAAGDPYALFARARTATGGDAWNAVGGLRVTGYLQSGTQRRPFSETVDHRTGWWRQATQIGTAVDITGFDGVNWEFDGKAFTEETDAALRRDAMSNAYMRRDGWWKRSDVAEMTELPPSGDLDVVRVMPAFGSPIEVGMSRATGRIERIVTRGESVATIRYEDYRTIDGIGYAFRAVATDSAMPGVQVVTNVTQLEVLKTVNRADVSRPGGR